MKKFVIFILVILVIGGSVYQYLNIVKEREARIPQAPNWKAITAEAVIDPVSAYDSNAIWYGLSSGRLMRLDLSNNQATEYVLPAILGDTFKSLIWPKTGQDFLAVGNIQGANTFNYYNYTNKAYTVLPKNVLNLDWLNDGKRVVMVWKSNDGKTTSLVTSNADASGYKVLAALPWENMVVKASPTSNKALLYSQLTTEQVNKIYLFDLQTGQYTEAVATGKNTGLVWSPTGNHFAFVRIGETGSEIFIHDMLTGQDQFTGVLTGIGRIAFSPDGSKLYAAEVEEGTDIIWAIDVDSGDKSLVYGSELGIKAKNIFLVGQKLYFVGSLDNKIYTVE